MTLILWSLEPMLTLVGVADQSVPPPHARVCKKYCYRQLERPPPRG